jgi:hypothetical protein
MMKKTIVIGMAVLIAIGLVVSLLNFVASEARADAVFGTKTVVVDWFPDNWICIGDPRNCCIVYAR